MLPKVIVLLFNPRTFTLLGFIVTALHCPRPSSTGRCGACRADQDGRPSGAALVSTIIAQIIGFTIGTWFVSIKVLPKVIVLLHHFLQVPPTLFRFALEGIKVQDILDRSRSHPGHSLTVKAFAETWLLPGQHDYVVVEQRKLAGIVSLSMLRYLPRSEWESTTLGRVLRQNTPHAYSDELVEDALQRMTENSLTVLPVEDKESGEFIGSVSSNEVLGMVALTAKGHEI